MIIRVYAIPKVISVDSLPSIFSVRLFMVVNYNVDQYSCPNAINLLLGYMFIWHSLITLRQFPQLTIVIL
jgi:hypothetical protein